VSKQQTNEMYRYVEVKFHAFKASTLVKVSGFKTRPHYSRQPFDRRLSGSQSRYDCNREATGPISFQESKPGDPARSQ